MSKPSGLIAAVHTPVTSDFQLNLDVVEQQAELLLSNGCTGSYVAGTTGECHSLTCKQRLDLAQRWYDIIHDTSLYQINHIGSNILSESVELAAHSESLGIDGIAAMAPCFFRPTSVDEWIAYLKPIADAAPSTPLALSDPLSVRARTREPERTSGTAPSQLLTSWPPSTTAGTS